MAFIAEAWKLSVVPPPQLSLWREVGFFFFLVLFLKSLIERAVGGGWTKRLDLTVLYR